MKKGIGVLLLIAICEGDSTVGYITVQSWTSAAEIEQRCIEELAK